MFYCYIFLIRDISGMGEKGRSIGWPNLGPLLLFFAPFENILFKNRISLFVELKYLWELPLSSSPVVCEANFPMGFANCRNNCQGTAILHSLHLLKNLIKSTENIHISVIFVTQCPGIVKFFVCNLRRQKDFIGVYYFILPVKGSTSNKAATLQWTTVFSFFLWFLTFVFSFMFFLLIPSRTPVFSFLFLVFSFQLPMCT